MKLSNKHIIAVSIVDHLWNGVLVEIDLKKLIKEAKDTKTKLENSNFEQLVLEAFTIESHLKDLSEENWSKDFKNSDRFRYAKLHVGHAKEALSLIKSYIYLFNQSKEI